MTSYEEEDPDLIYMVKNSESNYDLPDLFDTIVRDLDYYNSEEFKEKRRRFASKYSYSNNIKRIEEFISAR